MKESYWYFMRLWEKVGCRPHSTQLAVERRALKNTVMALYFKMGFQEIWLTNHSRGTQSRFLLKSVSIAINSQCLDKNTSWMILGRFEVVGICLLVCDAFDTTLGRQTHLRIF